MKEKISIIVPVYKVEQYLKECLNSIINQTYKNLEIILIDDGSPDNCGKICDEYAEVDSRIKVIHKENGGLSSARNAGLDIATGEYISFIDSDDYVSEDFIYELYRCAEIGNSDIVQCEYTSKDFELELQDLQKSKTSRISTKEAIDNLNIKNHAKYIVVWNKLYKKYLFEKVRFPIGRINEDTFVTYKLFWNCKTEIFVTDRKLYYYRQRNDSIMNKKFNVKRYDALDGYREELEFFIENKSEENIDSSAYLYQRFLKDFWYKTNNEKLENKNENLKNLLKRSRSIYKYIIFNNKISIKNKIIYSLFNISPNIYFGIIKLLKEIKIILTTFFIILKYLSYKIFNKNEYVLFGSPIYGNIGDHAIKIATRKFFNTYKKDFFEINSTHSANLKIVKWLNRVISKKATICIIGGGFVGSLWDLGQKTIENVISLYKNNKIVIFPQTLHYSDDDYGKTILEKDIDNFNKHNSLYLFWREHASYDKAKEIFKMNKNFLCPDMVLYLDAIEKTDKNNKVLVCIRNDKEKKFKSKVLEEVLKDYEVDYTDTVVNKTIKSKESEKYVLNKIKDFSKYEFIITDRLHGMILSALANTKCIALDNTSHKVKGVYNKWMKNLNYIVFSENEEEIKSKINELKQIKSFSYNFDKSLYNDLKVILELENDN